MRRWLIPVGLVMACSSTALGQSTTSLQGAWRVTEYTSGSTGRTNVNPQPGILIFTAKHYAFVRDLSAKPRPNFRDPAHPTPQEALEIWGPTHAQAGTYEIVGDQLVNRILASKDPAIVNGTPDQLTFKVDGKTLTVMTVPPPGHRSSVIKLTRIE